MQMIVVGGNYDTAAVVAARFLPHSACFNSVHIMCDKFSRRGRPLRLGIYFDTAVLRIIDRIYTPLSPALPLGQYLTPINPIVSSPV